MESQGFQFDPTFLWSSLVLLPSPIAFSVIIFLLLAHYFRKSCIFERQALLSGSFVVIERLGEEYFRRWYVQRMLPYATGISYYAFISYYFSPLFLNIF